jgi:hypothetical protein
MTIEKTTTNPLTTGIADDAGATREYNDRWYLHREQSSTDWVATGGLQNVSNGEMANGLQKLMDKLDPGRQSTWRVNAHELPNPWNFATTASGTGAVTMSAVDCILTTGTTSGGTSCALYSPRPDTSTNSPGAAWATLPVGASTDWGLHARFKLASTSALGATSVAVVGAVNSNTPTDGIKFGVHGPTSTNTWSLKQGWHTTAIGTTTTIDTSWHDVDITRLSGVTTVYLDGTSVATSTSGYVSTATCGSAAFCSQAAGGQTATITVSEIITAAPAR